MKKQTVIFLLFIMLCSAQLFSQVKYTSSGNFGIGTPTPGYQLHLANASPYMYLNATTTNNDATIRLTEITGEWYGGFIRYDGGNNQMIIGVNNSSSNSTADDKDVLRINRANGEVYIYYPNTAAYGASLSTIAPNNTTKCYIVNRSGNHNFFVYGNGHIYHKGITDLSDLSVKENVKEVSNSLNLIKQLRPVSYNYKNDSVELSSERDLNYGLIAQEVEEIIPDVVNERDDGLKGICYNEITALLIDALQEQQNEIETIKSQLTDLNESKLKSVTSMNNDPIEYSNTALFQNVPNPFNLSTTIRYILPEIISYAMINVYDLQGKQINCYKVTQSGEGEIEIPESSLNPGIYIYNLIVDGTIIDSKQMVLTQ